MCLVFFFNNNNNDNILLARKITTKYTVIGLVLVLRSLPEEAVPPHDIIISFSLKCSNLVQKFKSYKLDVS